MYQIAIIPSGIDTGDVYKRQLYAQPIADVISAIVTVFMALHLHKELATTKEH